MKKTILATLVTSVILSGCFLDSDDPVPPPAAKSGKVQAFDGAVWKMGGFFDCGDGGAGPIAATGFDGFSTVVNDTFADNPTDCSVTFGPTPGAVDVSNGKDMSKVTYKSPKGLFVKDATATASPFSTLIANSLTESGEEEYTESAASQILLDLGIDLSSAGFAGTVTEFLQDTEAAISGLDNSEAKSKILATTVVLSDALTSQGSNKTVDDIVSVTKTLTKGVLNTHPGYPTSGIDGEEIYVDFTDALSDDEVFKEIPNEEDYNPDSDSLPGDIDSGVSEPTPIDPPEPPTDPEPPTGGGGDPTGGSGNES